MDTDIRRVGVVVPVHNEQRLLPGLLATALRAAAAVRLPVRMAIVLDACTDESRSIAEAAMCDLPAHVRIDIVDIQERMVGAARRAGAARLLAERGPNGLWIANTDADCRVPPLWLANQVDHARRGADAVAGTILVDDWSPRAAPVRRIAQRAYDASPHRHVHGANLGVRAEAYSAVGGFERVPAHEDAMLVAALQSIGASVVWPTDLAVATSARRNGRAPAGFAAYLNRLERRLAPLTPRITPPREAPAPRALDPAAEARPRRGSSARRAPRE